MKEDEYLSMVERHTRGKYGERGIDLMMPVLFAELVNAITAKDVDVLGDLLQGSITYGEAGQYLSPDSIAEVTVVEDRASGVGSDPSKAAAISLWNVPSGPRDARQ